MFINSIFLPKTLPEQGTTENKVYTANNFTHLFSNVFKIVKDEKEKPLPINFTEPANSVQHESVNVSLFADKKINLDNPNISMIISDFLSRINKGEEKADLSLHNNIRINDNVPQYFSITKEEFLKELKNIIDNLNNQGNDGTKKIEISLIANGQLMTIDSLKNNAADVEGWINEQLKSSSDFEIVVKSGQKKYDVQPTIVETLQKDKTVAIISGSTKDETNSEEKSLLNNTSLSSNNVVKNADKIQSDLQPPLKDVKQIIPSENKSVTSQVKSNLENKIIEPITTSELFSANKEDVKPLSVHNAVKIETAPGKQNESEAKTAPLNLKENVLTDLNDLTIKTISSEKAVEAGIKALSSEIKLNSNSTFTETVPQSSKGLKQTSGSSVKEVSKTDKKLNIISNQKINSVFFDKKSVKENAVLDELIEKTNVEKIDISFQKLAKPNTNSTNEIRNVKQTENAANKENLVNNKSSIIVDQVNKNNLIENATKISINKNTLKAAIDNSKNISSANNLQGNQQELFTNETEEIVTSQTDKSQISSKNIIEKINTKSSKNSYNEIKNAKEEQIINADNQNRTKNVKVDFMQRRVYSQIPPLEVIADDAKIKDIKNSDINVETNKDENTQTIDKSVKSSQNAIGQKAKEDKQVWVKVSLEKNENEKSGDIRKSLPQNNKITIDASIDKTEKDLVPNNIAEKESQENQKTKPQIISAENNRSTEQRVVPPNHNDPNQPGNSLSVKPEIKTEHNAFKPELHNENTNLSSRTAEMVEKVKVVSSNEMLREVYKVFESGEKKSIVLRLVPKELGSIKVMLDTVDNILTAKVEVENENVGQVIKNNVEQLRQNLLQSGVNVNSINISYHNQEHKQHGFNNQKKRNQSYLAENEIEEIEESILTKKMGYNTYEYLI